MKKLIAFIIAFSVMLSFSGCIEEKTVTPNSFPLELSFINEALAKSGIDAAAQESMDYDENDDLINYSYSLKTGEYPLDEFFGFLQVLSGPERGNYVSITVDVENGDADGAEKIVNAVCELYGSPDGRKVAKKLTGDVKSGDTLEKIDYAGYKWEYELNGVYFSALFGYTVNYDGSETVSMVSFSAGDKMSYDFDNNSDESLNRIKRENREKYPLLYTMEEKSYPPQPADEDIIALFSDNSLGIAARTAATANTNGTSLTQYNLWDENADACGIASVRYYVSGKQSGVIYNMVKSDYNLREDAVEKAVKIACLLHGNIADTEKVVPAAEKIAEEYDYMKAHSLNVYFEHGDVYIGVNFGFDSFDAQKAGRAQFGGITVYDKALYTAMTEYGMK